MAPFRLIALLLSLSAAAALNFTSVYEWDQFDFNWSSSDDLKGTRNFEPNQIYPLYLAVSGQRLFLSLRPVKYVPASLAWLPTQDATSSHPKLSPYPSWAMTGMESCKAVQSAKGIATDNMGRLWVLDNGHLNCQPKLWIFNMADDSVHLLHEFPNSLVSAKFTSRNLNDLAIDETIRDNLHAYFSATISGTDHLFVYRLKENQIRLVATQKIQIFSLAFSPMRQRLYVSGANNPSTLYSISTPDLRAGVNSVSLARVGNKMAPSHRMAMDGKGVLYSDLISPKGLFVATWNTNLSFKEERIYQGDGLYEKWPFTFAFDAQGDFWITLRYNSVKPTFKLLKYKFSTSQGCDGRRSCVTVGSTTTPAPPTTKRIPRTTTSKKYQTLVARISTKTPVTDKVPEPPAELKNSKRESIWIIILICSNVFTLIFCGLVILCLCKRMKTPSSEPQPLFNMAFRKHQHKTHSILSDEIVAEPIAPVRDQSPTPDYENTAPAASSSGKFRPYSTSDLYEEVQNPFPEEEIYQNTQQSRM
ncbi:major royal jelly protein 1-like [Cloeon dipterum]|uniref:major royal jelly protein 1-like n=1 Tax=Cloeon dipterum TaxID=197152 RepID=UPI0032204C07